MSNRFLKKTIIFLFHLMVLSVPFAWTWVNDELFEFNKMILVYGYTVLITGVWLARMINEKKILVKRTYLDIPIGLFLFSQIASTLFSVHPYTSIFGYYSRFHGGLLSTISYILLFYAFVNNVGKKQLKYFFLTVFVAGLGVALYAIPEHFNFAPSCLTMTIFDGNPGVVASTDCWSENTNPRFRIFGTFGQPNWLAAYAIMLIPVGLAFSTKYSLFQAEKSNNQHYKWLFASTTVLLLVATLFSKSRSGALGFGIGMIVFYLGVFLLWSRAEKKIKNKIINQWTLALPAILLGLIAVFGSSFTPSVRDIFSTPTQETSTQEETSPQETTTPINRLEVGGTDSGEIRKIVWEGAWKVWRRYPIFGSGVETFAYSYYQDRPLEHNNVSEWDFLYNKAHNELLNILATTGIVGLVGYLSLFLWFGIKSLLFFFSNDEQKSVAEKLLVLGLVSGLIALSVSNFFGFSTVAVSMMMFLYFAVFAVLSEKSQTTQEQLSNSARKKLARLGEPELKKSWFEYTLLAITIIASLYFLNRVYNLWKADYAYATAGTLVNNGQVSQSAPYLQEAIRRRPNEALYFDRFSTLLGQAALVFAQQEQQTEMVEAAESAIVMSNRAKILNPVHLNFYKSRALLLTNLAILDEELLLEARKTYQEAQELSPTDPKIVYRLGLIDEVLGSEEEAINKFELAVEMKPDYVQVRKHLGDIYLKQEKPQQALEHLHEVFIRYPEDAETQAKIASIGAMLAK